VTSLGTGRQTLGDRYELEELIAAGGMGQVWRGRDRLLDRPVAVKVLRSEYADDPVFLERFRGEARHAAALNHPNIAAVLDYGESEDAGSGEHLAYLVMELVEGAPLSARISAEGPLEPEDALSVLRQTAAGLAEAHRAGMVHRDVKPANILVRPDGRVKLTDFGIAWSAESVPLTGTGQVIGTARYMSPEQAAGARVGPASDVYALGLVGYESLTGHAAFEGTNPVTVALKQVRETPEPLPADVPPGVRDLIDAALVKDPGERLPDAGAFLSAVEETIERTTAPREATHATLPVPAAPLPAAPAPAPAVVPAAAAVAAAGPAVSPEPPRSTRPTRRRRALVLVPLLAVLVVGLVVGLLVLLRPDGAGDRPAQAAGRSAPPSADTGESPAAATAIVLDAADHVGRPADDVEADLTALGLTVARQTEETTAVEPGTVAGLDPVGVALRPGDPVTIAVAGAPPGPGPSPAGDGAAEDGAAEDGSVEDGAAGPSSPGSDQVPAEPAPAEQAPVEQAPVEQAPVDPAPADPAPAEQAPAEPAPSGPAASDPAPSDPAPAAPAPSAPAPSDAAPSDAAPSDPAPSDPAPSDPAPSDPAPSAPASSAPASSAAESAPETPTAPADTPAPADGTGAGG
jgi:serine/threonine-protein kinase